MYLEINTDNSKIYEQYLTFLNPFLNLTPNEIKVLAAVLFLYRETEGGKEEFRWGYVFSTEGKARLKDFTEMNANQINLTLSSMSKKQMLGEDILIKEPYKHIHPKCVLDPIKNPFIQIKFKFEDEQVETKVQEPLPVTTEARTDNNRDREEVWDRSEDFHPNMVSAVPQYEEEDKPVNRKDSGKYISPREFSRNYAIPVRKVHTEPEKSESFE